jgi:hypothetical protein
MQKQRKPEIGKRYKIWKDRGYTLYNTMLVIDVIGNTAIYVFNYNTDIRNEWDYIEYSEFLDYELSSLEMELL